MMRIVGLVEQFTPRLASGYCYNADNPARPITLELRVNNLLVDTKVASLKRPNFQKNKLPNLRCGFKFSFKNLEALPTRANTRVSVRGTDADLGLHTLNLTNDNLYPNTIDPMLAAEANSYSNLVIVNHIPKTAGTSLRIAFERSLKKKHCASHYLDMKYCDDQIWNWKFSPDSKTGFEDVVRSVLRRRIRVLCGHFGHGIGDGLVEFIVCFPNAKLITFLREPFQQSYSYFLHATRSLGLSQNFGEFIAETQYQNIQSRYFGKIALDRYDFVGVVEEYSSSLKWLSHFLGYPLAERFANRNRRNRGAIYDPAKILSKELLLQFYACNQEDVRLYNDARDRFWRQVQK